MPPPREEPPAAVSSPDLDALPADRERPADDVRDARLIEAARRGDASAMDRLVAIYMNQVARYSYVILRDEEKASDAVQETFLRVMQSLVRFDTSRSFKPWLFTLARRSCLDMQRQDARRAAALRAGAEALTGFEAGFATEVGPDGAEESVPVAIDPAEDIRVLMARREDQQRALAALGRLDEEARQILSLRLLEDLTFQEIADLLGRPLSTITTIFYRRLAKLRTILEGMIAEEQERVIDVRALRG